MICCFPEKQVCCVHCPLSLISFSVRVFGPPAFMLFLEAFICQTVVILFHFGLEPNFRMCLVAMCALSFFLILEPVRVRARMGQGVVVGALSPS